MVGRRVWGEMQLFAARYTRDLQFLLAGCVFSKRCCVSATNACRTESSCLFDAQNSKTCRNQKAVSQTLSQSCLAVRGWEAFATNDGQTYFCFPQACCPRLGLCLSSVYLKQVAWAGLLLLQGLGEGASSDGSACVLGCFSKQSALAGPVAAAQCRGCPRAIRASTFLMTESCVE